MFRDYLSSVEELIEDARNGRMFILTDAEDRENEGDLVIPAQMCTPQAVNFMAKYGRGLICLALTSDRAETLQIPMMTQVNGTPNQTAFTVSIEAKEGISTGISAHDRAHTISVAIDATKGPNDIVSPGHVFPLVARHGGTLVRAGHTEAAVDIAWLAGLNPAGVICEIMNDDGTMARLDDLVVFAQTHRLKIGTIADLIAYRRRTDVLIECVREERFVSEYGGEWRARVYSNRTEGTEHLALIKGEILADRPTLVRMHAFSLFDDMLAQAGGRAHLIEGAMDAIGREGAGVLVMIRNFESIDFTEMFEASRRHADQQYGSALREYGVGAQILVDLGVKQMELLSNTPRNAIVGLDGYGLTAVGVRPFERPGLHTRGA